MSSGKILAFFALMYAPCVFLAVFTRKDNQLEEDFDGGYSTYSRHGAGPFEYYLCVAFIIDLAITAMFKLITQSSMTC